MLKSLPGSPPRMRGKAFYLGTRQRAQRITPAYAGKRAKAAGNKLVNEDHPRVCGEKLQIAVVVLTAIGSPPRMRGKEARHKLPNKLPRITPAYAGKSINHWKIKDPVEDHPRVCGEKTKKIP